MQSKTEHAGDLPFGIWRIAAVAAIGSFMANLDAAIVNLSLSSLAGELHAGLSTIQWVMTGYLLALALVLPLNGWLVDRIGIRAVYLWCFAAFTASSALCGAAWSAPALISFRVLQGISGGLLAPMAQLLIARAAGRQMPRIMGFVTVPILLAPLLGPVLAGLILQFGSWRWLFLVNLPVGLLGWVLAAWFLPDDRAEIRSRPLDLVGLSLLSPGLVLFLYGADHAGAPIGAAALGGALLLLLAYGWSARGKGDAALINLGLFRRPGFAIAVVAMFLLNGAAFAGQSLTPIYLIQACGLSPGATGLLMAPLGLGAMVAFPLMGWLTDRFGIRAVAIAGAASSLLGTALLACLAYRGLVVALLAIALILRGIGLSLIAIPANTLGYAAVERQELPMAAAALNIGQRLGGPTWTTIGIAFLDWRLSVAHGQGGAANAYTGAFALLAALHGLILVAAFALPARLQVRSVTA